MAKPNVVTAKFQALSDKSLVVHVRDLGVIESLASLLLHLCFAGEYSKNSFFHPVTKLDYRVLEIEQAMDEHMAEIVTLMGQRTYYLEELKSIFDSTKSGNGKAPYGWTVPGDFDLNTINTRGLNAAKPENIWKKYIKTEFWDPKTKPKSPLRERFDGPDGKDRGRHRREFTTEDAEKLSSHIRPDRAVENIGREDGSKSDRSGLSKKAQQRKPDRESQEEYRDRIDLGMTLDEYQNKVANK